MNVNVQFKNNRDGSFGANCYSYRTELPLKPGDIVKVPTYRGESIARVARINVADSEIDEKIFPKLREITEYAEDAANE